MTAVAASPVATLEDLRALTLRRLAALARLAAIAAAIVEVVNRWFEADLLGDWTRVHRAFERVWRAIRLIDALDGKLRDSLRLIQAGVRPPAETPSKAAEILTADIERPDQTERPESPERLERETFPGLGARGLDALLKRPVEDIVARILDDLAVFPAWRDLAQAAWDGAQTDPDETARILEEPIAAKASAKRRRPTAKPTLALTAHDLIASLRPLPRPAPA